MKKVCSLITFVVLFLSCHREDHAAPVENPVIPLIQPHGFPDFNPAVKSNPPTLYGVELGEKLFHEKKLSGTNQVSCAHCHQPSKAFTDGLPQAIGVRGRVGLRNTPPIQNLAFLQHYNWDGHKRTLESQALVPIITREEMDSSILEVMEKLQKDSTYKNLFLKAFGDVEMTADRIYQ